GAVVLAILAILAVIGFRQFGPWLPGGPELVQNGTFADGEFTPPPIPPGEEPIVSPVDLNRGGGGLIHLAQAAKLLRANSSALAKWQVFGKGHGLPPACQPGQAPLDAIAWIESDTTFAIPPPPVQGPRGRYIDLTGYCSRPPSDFGGVSQVIEHLK